MGSTPCIPDGAGFLPCALPNASALWAITGNVQAPGSYDGFQQRSLVYNAGPARPGLAAALRSGFGVRAFPETAFNVFRYEILSLQQLVLSLR